MSKNRELYDRATALMPWGTQTNAKRLQPEYADVMPLFIDRAEGCRIRDVDGRWFIDYRSSLGPIILGHKHPAVDAAVRRQLEKGILFSMASPVELEVAEQLTALIPGLDQVRFMKTGNDANLCTVRLARAYTGRDHILTCDYHGFSDWFACGKGKEDGWWGDRNNGVPRALDDLVTRIPYGDIKTAEEVFASSGDRIACMIMVPYDWKENIAHDFVRRMRELTLEYGAVLIFDQVLTGFRLHLQGAQAYFDVIPDLTTYAKALANGYPVSAYGGRRDVMSTLERVKLTTTYAGDALSLSAASATLQVLQTEPVVDHIWEMGKRLKKGFEAAAQAAGLTARTFGLPPAVQFRFSDRAEEDEVLRRSFFRALFKQGIFATQPFLLNYAHKPSDIDETLQTMQTALNTLTESPTPTNHQP